MSGRFDGDDRKSTIQKYKFSILIFLMGGVMIWFLFLSGGDTNKKDSMCDEIITMIFDDPDNQRLYEEYPTIMNELLDFLDRNCPDYSVRIETEIKINVGEP